VNLFSIEKAFKGDQVDSLQEPNNIQIGDFETDSTDSSDIPSYEIRPDLLEKSQAFAETLRRTSIPKSDSMDAVVCFQAYDELDEIKNESFNDKLDVRLCNLVMHLLDFPTGIKPNALRAQYSEKYGAPIGYHYRGCKSLEVFTKHYLRHSTALLPAGSDYMKQKPKKDGTDKIIFKPYEVIIRKTENKSMQLLHNAIQNTKRITLRLLGILNVFKHSIYKSDIPIVYEHVYNQRLSEDGILECSLDCLLDAIEPFFRAKRSPFDGRKYYEGTEAILHSWITIEDNDCVRSYKDAAQEKNSKSTTRTLSNMMHALHDMKGIVFLPVAEVSARFYEIFKLPYTLPRSPFETIDYNSNFSIKTGFKIVEMTTTIFYLKDIIPCIGILQSIETHDMSDSLENLGISHDVETSIGYYNDSGNVFLARSEDYQSLNRLHQQMAKRYNNCNLPIDCLDDILVYQHVAAKMEESSGQRVWCRGEVRSVDKANEEAEIIAVDYGELRQVPFRFIRRLDKEFAEELPMLAIQCRLANVNYSQGRKLKTHVMHFIGEMMQKENKFYVKEISKFKTEYRSEPEIILTHIHTNFTFGGEITSEQAKSYRRKHAAQLQRQIQDLKISPSNSQSNFSSFSESSRQQSSISTLNPSCEEVCRFRDIDDEGTVFRYKIRDNAKPVYIIKSYYIDSLVLLGNLDEFVKAEERGTVISTKLQIKRWLREKVVEVHECPVVQNSQFQRILDEFGKDVRLVNLEHLAKCFRDLNLHSPANTSCKGNSIIVLEKSFTMFQAPYKYDENNDSHSSLSSNVSSSSDRNDDTINNLTADYFRTEGYSSNEDYDSASS
jgi:hypothetical protein